MMSIVLIESSCSKRYCWRDGKMPSITFYGSSALRFDSSSAASRKNTTADLRKRPLCSDQPIVRAVGRRYLEKFSNGCAKWTFARYGTKCARPRNSFFPSFSFLSTSTFISPFHTRKNGIRSSRKVSYKAIDTETGEENLSKT